MEQWLCSTAVRWSHAVRWPHALRRRVWENSMLITWKNEFAIDHGVIDDDHHFLFELVNQILEKAKTATSFAAMGSELTQLRGFAVKHFDREEKLQRASGYPLHADHRTLHRDLLIQLDQFVAAMAAQATDAGTVLRQLRSFLIRWLLSHIMDHDMSMRPYVEAMTDAAKTFVPLRAA
jgi:hemerythrin